MRSIRFQCACAQFSDLSALVGHVKKQCPGLRYFSVMKNPCCPNFLVSGGKDMHDYQLYRYYVLSQLQTLKFLDFQPVTVEEQAEARRRGQFMQVAKPKGADSGGEGAGGGAAAVSAAVEDDQNPLESGGGDHEARTYLGFNPYNYLGRESEGNRFISNNDL